MPAQFAAVRQRAMAMRNARRARFLTLLETPIKQKQYGGKVRLTNGQGSVSMEKIMSIYHGLQSYSRRENGAAVALGFFDGVHLGHRAVVGACAGSGLPCLVLTFAEAPAAALGREYPPLLTDNKRKAELLGACGAQDIVFADFNAVKALSPEDFVREILLERLNARQVFCGFNYRFGAGGVGDTAVLFELCGRYGIGVTVCEPVYRGGEPVSSTRIRACIAAGDMEQAKDMLGGYYAVEGEIGGGNRIGSVMGFPTVNIPLREGLAIPRFGVYASVLTIDGKSYRGATNIGVHPTVEEIRRPLCESFLLDFEGGDLYGKNALCELRQFIRGERRFAGIEELSAQIREDCQQIEQILG